MGRIHTLGLNILVWFIVIGNTSGRSRITPGKAVEGDLVGHIPTDAVRFFPEAINVGDTVWRRVNSGDTPRHCVDCYNVGEATWLSVNVFETTPFIVVVVTRSLGVAVYCVATANNSLHFGATSVP